MTVVISMQAQQDPSQANISVAEAAAAASNAKHWMKMQNSGRTSGGEKTEDYTLQLILLEMTALLALHFFHPALAIIYQLYIIFQGQGQDAATTSVSSPANKTGRRAGTTAIKLSVEYRQEELDFR